MIRLLLVDTVTTFRESLAFMLDRQEGMSVVGQAATLAEAQAVLTTTEVDVVLMAFELDAQERLELVRTLRDARSAAVIVMLAGNLDQQTRTVAVAAAGALLLNPADVLQDAVLLQIKQEEAERALQRLSPREVDVLRALAAGLDNDGIANRLSVAKGTVYSHMDHILRKLGVTSRLQAVLFALRYGLFDLRDIDD
jgi:DNA-binding NarL/FixJ family response regulator